MERNVRVMRIRPPSSDDDSKTASRSSKNKTRARYNVSLLKTKGDRTAFHLSLANRFQPLQDQLEDRESSRPAGRQGVQQTSWKTGSPALKLSGSTSRNYGETHVKKSSAEEGHNTRSGSCLIP
jgi:hypothetical protein